MKLESIHILLTYQCNYECDHCFVWSSPWQTGVLTTEKLEQVFNQALALRTVTEIYFEGGEPFLYYPIMLRAIARATELGFDTGIVTNGYWAQSLEDALVWLRPLAEAGLNRIELSCDEFHGARSSDLQFFYGSAAAKQLGLNIGSITIEPPANHRDPETSVPGEAISGGGVMYRGRAASVLTAGLPTHYWEAFARCPYEDLVDPGRIHLDPFGNLHICQGIVIGNLFEKSLAEIIHDYNPLDHPITGPLLIGGPAQLVREFSLAHETGYVDVCHLCYSAREQLRPEFPAILAPPQMYGVIGVM